MTKAVAGDVKQQNEQTRVKIFGYSQLFFINIQVFEKHADISENVIIKYATIIACLIKCLGMVPCSLKLREQTVTRHILTIF